MLVLNKEELSKAIALMLIKTQGMYDSKQDQADRIVKDVDILQFVTTDVGQTNQPIFGWPGYV